MLDRLSKKLRRITTILDLPPGFIQFVPITALLNDKRGYARYKKETDRN
jgi:hypothetical protein